MEIIQIKDILKSAINQTLGSDYFTQEGSDGTIKELDLSKITDVGKDVENAMFGVDKYTNACIDLISKIVIQNRKYTAKYGTLYVDSLEWGAFVEKVKFGLASILDDPAWQIEDGKDFSSVEHTFYSPTVSTKLFGENKPYMVPLSRTRRQVMTSFNNDYELNKFYTGIETEITNTLEIAYQSFCEMITASAIAITMKKTLHEVKLLTDYNNINASELTPAAALRNDDFLAYACEVISNYEDELETMGTRYNNANIPTFSNKDNQRLFLLGRFEKAIKFNVKANTYHDDLIGVGQFETITKWQAFKNSDSKIDFATMSQIKIKADPTNKLGIGTAAVTLNNVVGFLHDKEAIGVTFIWDKTTSNYTASGDFNTYFSHRAQNGIVDDDMNMIAFTLN